MAGLSAALRRRLAPACLLLAALALAAAAERGWSAWRQTQDNARMALAEPPQDREPRVLLARAVALEARGRFDEALADYAEVEARDDAALRHAARVNVANLYLRRGIAVAREDGNAERALVLLQLAKSGLRRALRERPDDWNARYNLELAQRLLPDVVPRDWRRSGDEPEIPEAMKRDKSAWTEMVSPPRGMP